MKILVAGPWDPKPAREFKEYIIPLGKSLAEQKHDIVFGPGSGIVVYTVEGYTSVPAQSRGKITFFMPHPKEMIRLGEDVSNFADEIIQTDADYLDRTITMCRLVDAFVSVAGASGTLYEAITMMFLKKPVVILDGVGNVGSIAPHLKGISDYAYFAKDVDDVLVGLEKKSEELEKFQFDLPWYNV